MGCCLGTTAANHHRHPDDSKLKTKAQSLPAPPPFEEETVKEVLSETPIITIPKTPPPPPPIILDHRQIPQPEEEPNSVNDVVESTKTLTGEIQENASEMSEMYSYSETFSAATTATTVADTKKDEIEMEDDGEVTQKLNHRSPPAKRVPRKRPTVSSGEIVGRKERGATRPLARRQMAPSPEKKRQSPARTMTNPQRHRNVGKEVTGRRSRSPAVRGETGQRRKVRERSPVVEKSGEVIPVKAVESEGVEMADNGGVSPSPELQTSESLENPLVSLECFIFL